MMEMTPAERLASADAVRRQADEVADRASSYALSVVRGCEMAREKRKQEQPPDALVAEVRAVIERAYMAGVLSGMQVLDVEVAHRVKNAVNDRDQRLADKKARGRR